MTPEEQLDEARAEEAYRQWQEEGCQGDDTIDVAAIAARLAREDSEARIKELEAALGHFLGSYCDTAFWDVENEPEVIAARALLKEPDQ